MNTSEVAKLLGKTKMTIINWCESGKIKANKIPSKGRHGFTWDIPDKEVLRTGGKIVAKAEATEDAPKIIQVVPAQQESDDDTAERKIIGEKRLSRAEAERVKKEEEARKLQLDNLRRERLTIDREWSLQVYEDAHSALVENIEEMVDVWAIRYNLAPDQAKQMRADIKIMLVTENRKLKNEFKASIS